MGDLGSIPGLERYCREGNSYQFQYSGLENSIDCIVHGVTVSNTTKRFHLHFSALNGMILSGGAFDEVMKVRSPAVFLQEKEETRAWALLLSFLLSLSLPREDSSRRYLPPKTKSAGSLILDVSASRTVRNTSLLFRPPPVKYFGIAALSD